jgi:hypothetical protein
MPYRFVPVGKPRRQVQVAMNTCYQIGTAIQVCWSATSTPEWLFLSVNNGCRPPCDAHAHLPAVLLQVDCPAAPDQAWSRHRHSGGYPTHPAGIARLALALIENTTCWMHEAGVLGMPCSGNVSGMAWMVGGLLLLPLLLVPLGWL